MSCELAQEQGPYETYEGSPMSKGKLQAMGSPDFLKRKFGCGYQLTVVPSEGNQTQMLLFNLRQLVQKHLSVKDNDAAADGFKSTAAAAAQKKLAPVAQRFSIVHRVEAVAFLLETAAAAAAAATTVPSYQKASRIARGSFTREVPYSG